MLQNMIISSYHIIISYPNIIKMPPVKHMSTWVNNNNNSTTTNDNHNHNHKNNNNNKNNNVTTQLNIYYLSTSIYVVKVKNTRAAFLKILKKFLTTPMKF